MKKVLITTLFFLMLLFRATPVLADTPYTFNGDISQQILINYLSKAVEWMPPVVDGTMDKYVSRVGFDQFYQETAGVGAKFILSAENTWRNESIYQSDISNLQSTIDQTHIRDPDIIFNVFLAERVNRSYVNVIPIPAYVFQAFGLPVQTRNFNYSAMFGNNWPYVNEWGMDSSVPDITQAETQMWYYYYATQYINVGFESVWLGQVYLTATYDTGYTATNSLVEKIHEYGKAHARRGVVLVISHQLGDVTYQGKQIFDFSFYPTQFMLDQSGKMTASLPMAQYVDCDHYPDLCKFYQNHPLNQTIPLLLMLDNGGPSNDLYVPQLNGYDPITYFATRTASERHDFLSRAYNGVMQQTSLARFALPSSVLATDTTDRKLCPDDSGVFQLTQANDYESAPCGDVDTLKSIYSPPTPTPTPKPSDLNGDGKVDIYDYNILVANFGHPYTIFDYNNLVGNFGK